MAEVFSKLLRKSIRYVNISDQAAAEGMRKAGLPEYVIEGLVGTFATVRSGKLAKVTDDVERITGRLPRTFETWCRNNLAAFL